MAYDAGAAFARIEAELIESMMRNLQRYHLDWEEDEGFDWSQWQVEQLKYLEEYRRQNEKKYGPRFASINRKIEEAIRHAEENGQKEEELRILRALAEHKSLRRRLAGKTPISGAGDAFFRINNRKLEALIEATRNDLQKAEYAVLRRTNDQYRQIIFDAQVYANTGAGTIEKAVDMATHDFLARGIDCIEYKNGARHTISDWADMAVRTAERRAYLAGEGRKRQEWGVSLVIVNRRGTMTGGNHGRACPLCVPWLGKILIDDVYSGGKADGKHTLLSEAMAAGFLHPRCKDGFTTYFPGISSTPDPATRGEIREAVEAEKEENRENYVQRQAEKFDRLAKYSLDPENKRKYEARAEEWERASDLSARRRQRAEEWKNRHSEETNGIDFDERVSQQQRDLIQKLAREYNTRLQRVTIGAEKAAGDMNMTGGRMRLSDKRAETAIHEFAHTLANSEADKLGLTEQKEFWKEIRKIRREYHRDVDAAQDTARWISTYEHAHKSVDEFMAEAFTHAKMRELGLPIPDKYGNDFTYSQRVLDTVNKYFGKTNGIGGLPGVAKAKLVTEGNVSRYLPAVHESRVVDVMRKEYARWVESLSKKELHAIRKYTRNSMEKPDGKFYRRLNAMLRGDILVEPTLKEYADTISGALKRQPLQEAIICYRNVNVNPFEGKIVGGVVEGKQFYSTSVIASRTMPGRYHLAIYAPKGTPGAYIGNISRVKSQHEFLIDKDCRYRLLSIQGNDIVMEVII